MIEIIRSLVRPFITINITGLVWYLTIKGLIDAKEILAIFLTIVGFYFAERMLKKQNGGSQ